MADIAELGIKIDSKGVRTAVKELDRLETQSGKTEKATSSLTKQALKLAAAVGALAAIKATISAIIRTTAEFEQLNASLETVTGSMEGATEAMDMIRATASTTPFSVQQLTESFIKLKALGLDPSSAALVSYGNTASAMGKSLNQVVEAVADATTGEFERLKEFGIKAKSEGDRVSFTFQGVTTNIGKNAAEIEQFIRNIGDVQFAGAMEKQMDTINGAFSNMGDNLDNLLLKMGEAGVAGATKASILELSALLSDPGLINKATQLTTALIGGFTFLSKAVTQFILELTDLGDMIGAVAAATASAFALDFDAASAILAARKEERAELDKVIEKIWEKEKATKAVNQAEAESPATGLAGGGVTQGTVEPPADKDQEKLRERLERRLVTLEDHFATETERSLQAWMDREELIDELEEERIITQAERDELKVASQEELESRLTEITRQGFTDRERFAAMSSTQQTKHVVGEMIKMTQGVATHSKKLFAINKAAGIANAIINTYQGVTQALAAYPPPLSFAMAAIQLAAGLVQVNKIKSASFGGGGGGGSVGGGGGGGVVPSDIGTPTPQQALNAPTAEPTRIVNVTVLPGIRTGEDVVTLMEEINEQVGDGVEFKATVLA
jgi:hypothetical protein